MTDTLIEDSVPPRIDGDGPIIGVVVHGRGAVITRRIELVAELPSTAFDLVIGGITPLADPGSVRVRLPDGGRSLVGVKARVDVPEQDEGPGPSAELVETLNRRIDRMHEREKALKGRVGRLQEVLLTPMGGKAIKSVGPTQRVEFALAIGEVVGTTVQSIDRRIIDLRVDLERTIRERDAAQLEDAQTSSAQRKGSGQPSRAFDLRIAAGAEELRSLEVSYAVPYAAKWWPQYTLRLTEAGTRASLTLEALIAQRTGEDWDGVPVGLSTASIIFDATLPKLPSLRLGKRQPPEARGFREPPSGGEKLFDSYDSFRGRLPAPVAGRVTMRDEPAVSRGHASPPPPRQAPMSSFASNAQSDEEWEDDATGSFAEEAAVAKSHMQMNAPVMSAQKMRKSSSVLEMAAGAVAASFGSPAEASEPYGGAPGGGGGFDQPVVSNDPGDNWLEFDALVLAERDSSNRGRLKRRPDASGLPASELYDAQDSARRMNLTDPVKSRGLFDYRYDSDGTARIPADGRLHRIELAQRPADSHLEWRTVPLVDPAVYREAVLHNPFESPLLAGPVDVFSEGQLVTVTHVDRIDAGGTMRVGLGIDERLRVARNVRMVEESAGLLGGKRELIHDVEIELRSGLGEAAEVEVIDRLPVTTDDHVDIDFVDETQPSEEYDQAALDHPIEGGRSWAVKLAAGGKSTIEYRYQVTLRSKDELVGGNRRG